MLGEEGEKEVKKNAKECKRMLDKVDLWLNLR